jgi:hypothetical protein
VSQTLPISVPPSNQYGSAVQLEDAQRQVPMAPAPVSQPAAPGPLDPMGGAVEPAVAPGQFGPLDAPSERPDEPITAGAPIGAGPGPEALSVTPRKRGADLVIQAAEETADPLLLAIAERLKR